MFLLLTLAIGCINIESELVYRDHYSAYSFCIKTTPGTYIDKAYFKRFNETRVNGIIRERLLGVYYDNTTTKQHFVTR